MGRRYQRYVYGTFRRCVKLGAWVASRGSSPNSLLRNLLNISPRPSQIIISTIAYDTKLATDRFVRFRRTFAKGCGKACVADHGILPSSVSPAQTHIPKINSRKHHIQRNPKLLSAMNVGKARRIGNNRICDKRPRRTRVDSESMRVVKELRRPASIPRLET